MFIFKHQLDLQRHLKKLKKEGLSIGFVPTMGALHDGHMSLVALSTAQCDITVSSIFVNPSQFNDAKDLDNYPVTLEADLEKLIHGGCDVLFLPSANEMYPNGPEPKDHFDFGSLSNVLEGAKRLGHFNGMAQIVEKLLNAVLPDKLFMGQKDYQQQLIVRQLIKRMGIATELVMGKTVREPDGLAMSSRNVRLSEEERVEALKLSKALYAAAEMIGKRPVKEVIEFGFNSLMQTKDVKIDYFAVVNGTDLSEINDDHLPEMVVLLAAVFLPSTRLIDNVVISTR